MHYATRNGKDISSGSRDRFSYPHLLFLRSLNLFPSQVLDKPGHHRLAGLLPLFSTKTVASTLQYQ